MSLLDSGALNSVIGGGGNTGGGEKPGPLDSMVNAGATMTSPDGKNIIGLPQGSIVFGQENDNQFLSFLTAKIAAVVDWKKIVGEIFAAFTSSKEEISPDVQLADVNGDREAPVGQAQSLGEILGDSNGMLASVGATGGIDTSGSVAPMSGGGGGEMQIG